MDDSIKKYAPHKLLKITFNENGIRREDVEKYGELEDLTSYSCVIKTRREEAKNVAGALLSSGLPVDDILIDEIDVDDVIREIFGK